jgi:hypothetical protein
LSLGRLTEHCLIECPYHGWRYDGSSGACVVIPNLRADEKVPKAYRVQAYETFERNGFIQLLLGDGESTAEPEQLGLPTLDHTWESERLLVYPYQLLMETLVDCPDAILSIAGVRIVNDHRYGDPTLEQERLVVQYAGLDARHARRPKHAIADFPYLVRLSATEATARVELYAGAQLCSAAVLVAVAQGNRITRVLCRASGNALGASPFKIECTPHIDASAVSLSKGYVSRAWAEALAPVTVE